MTQAFRVKGSFLMGGNWSPFTVETIGEDDASARERVLSTLGSRHRVSRRFVRVDAVEKISVDEVENPVVEAQLEGVTEG